MTPGPSFLRRFEQIRTSLRRYQLRLGLALTVLAAAAAFGLHVWADYRLELPREFRQAWLAVVAAVAFVVFLRWVVAPLRWWTKPRTAVEIEGRFPQLGQRIRTVVQYAGLGVDAIDAAGVTPSLYGALEEETAAKVDPLPIDRVIPRRRFYAVAALAAVPVLLLAALALRSGEWRTAILRAFLVERPYTTIAVAPGNLLVDLDADVPIAVELNGRARAGVTLETRPAGKPGASWKSAPLDAPVSGPASRRSLTVSKVKDPFEYRVVAGPETSPTFRVDVRYPLVIKTFRVNLTPPAYTGLDPETVKGGDLRALQGTGAAFSLTFDVPPDAASIELTDPARKAKDETPGPPTVLPLRREGAAFVADLSLIRDLDYRVVATTKEGRFLPKNRHRIDVHEDRPPRVTFEEPEEALEVHPVAEVKNRVRAGDDYGLTRVGIVFRFNDGDEKSLILKDFTPPTGKKPRTAAALEETLLMETLAASPQDSVTYYGFAEDNFPGEVRRTETDLRYIDIRPFKRRYKLGDRSAGGEGDPEMVTTLDELIARQRFNLNRTNRLAKHRPGDRAGAEDPLKITGFEETLVGLTREFTEGVEGIAGEPVEALHRAQEAMTASVDALDRGRTVEAPAAMSEALKHLVSARRELLTIVGEDSALARALRAFDRKQAQKIRKPKSKDEEAEQIAAQIEELAEDEDFVYATLTAANDAPSDVPADKGKDAEPAEPKDADADKGADAKGEPKGADKKGEPKGADAKGEPKKGADAKGEPKKEGDAKGEPKKGADAKGEPKKEGDAKAPAQAQKGEPGQDKGKDGPKGMKGGKGSKDEGEEGEGSDRPGKLDRRGLAEKQEKVADTARDLEERLKRLQAASDLAKARMAKAAEKAEKALGALNRGNSKEAAQDAKTGAGMLHELARQVKGEIARESADELAMARDLAQELADREADLAGMLDAKGPGDREGEGKGEKGPKGSGPDGKDEKEAKGSKGKGDAPGNKGNARGGPGGLTEAERIDQMAEASRTLENWLKQIDTRGEGKASEAVHDLLQEGAVAEIVERTERMGELRIGGQREEAGREARDLSGKLERLGRSLELLHQGIVAPQLAALVEFDRRLADLTGRLGSLKSEAEIAAWHRDAAALIRDLGAAHVDGADDLADALRAGGRGAGGTYHWADGGDHLVAPATYTGALNVVASRIKDRIQDMILKDLASARDEATPPMYREQVERYYEVLSRGASGK